MKSLVMALNMLSISLGNAFAMGINALILSNESVAESLHGANYFWFFTGILLLAALLFIPLAWSYKGKTYMQDSAGLVDEPGQGNAT